MNRIVKSLCHVLWEFILSKLSNAKKGQNSVMPPENAQDSTIHYFLKTTIKLLIDVVIGISEYKTLNAYHYILPSGTKLKIK